MRNRRARRGAPLGNASTPAQLALSNALGFSGARGLATDCSPDFSARVIGTLVANYQWLNAAASVEARNSVVGPGAMAAAIATRPGTAIEVDGRFMCTIPVPAFDDARPMRGSTFKSHDLEWRVSLQPNGDAGGGGNPVVGLALLRGWPKIVRFQVGFINLMDDPLRESAAHVVLIMDGRRFGHHFADLTPARFREPAAGWVVRGVVAPFVRVLEVRDPTPVELAAAAAAANV